MTSIAIAVADATPPQESHALVSAPSISGSVTQPTTAAQELNFVRPLAGLPGLSKFVLAPFDHTGVLFTLTSLTVGGPQLFVVTPETFFPTFSPKISGAATTDLGLPCAPATGEAQAQMFVVLTLGDNLAEHTANLSAPILVNPGTGNCIQVVLEDEQYSVRTPLMVS
ncbi:flagellar assembly protein FliW [Jonesiaceae bacterium BS-20]|uniref:Flagellar assembly protein FliW n=1 Tax=Jonesiaceae bacterium BS-20 TaxID=3120821 RepID=A0AAU7DYU3_9MICO